MKKLFYLCFALLAITAGISSCGKENTSGNDSKKTEQGSETGGSESGSSTGRADESIVIGTYLSTYGNGGVVFYISSSRDTVKLVSINEAEGLTSSSAESWCASYGKGGWSVPTSTDFDLINNNIDAVNESITAFNGTTLKPSYIPSYLPFYHPSYLYWIKNNGVLAILNWGGIVSGYNYNKVIEASDESTARARAVLTLTGSKANISDNGESFALSDTQISTFVGGKYTLTAIGVPADQSVTWKSSNTSVATVSDGVVTGVSEGEATITASIKNKSLTCKVSVGTNAIYYNTSDNTTVNVTSVGGVSLTSHEWDDSKNCFVMYLSGPISKIGTEFKGKKITEITLPVSVTSIPESAFESCTSLTSVKIPNAKDIGKNAFRECKKLTDLYIPAAVTIGEDAINRCTSLKSISLPVATTIGKGSFYGCSSLESVDLPAATTIESYAFQGCTSLTSVNIPKVTDILEHTFYECSSLVGISLPVKTIGKDAFYKCTSLTSVSLPNATYIGAGAFYECTSLTNISLPVATTIGGESNSGAFFKCTSLTSVSLPKAVTIMVHAFFGCTKLNTVDCSKATNLESIGLDAFRSCTSLMTFKVGATVPPTCQYGNIAVNSGATLYVPASCVNVYKGTSPWSKFDNIVAL